jgi:cell pole-organizing protein PopZ
MAQAAKTPERSIDLVAAVRRIFDEDDGDKSAQNHHRDSMGSDSDAAQPSYPSMPAPDQGLALGLRPEYPIGDAVVSDRFSPTLQVAGPTSMHDMPSAEERGPVSKEANAAMHSVFNALAQTVLVENVRTLEDLVGQMLPAILKSWLDHNLPTMVERLLRAEIERVSRPKGEAHRGVG